jgi:hypothetical protein
MELRFAPLFNPHGTVHTAIHSLATHHAGDDNFCRYGHTVGTRFLPVLQNTCKKMMQKQCQTAKSF